MPNERENNYTSNITFADYNIAGNDIRAYYTPRHKIVFVLDRTINRDKPNVMLVMEPVGDRKWDDVLVNDYGIDLETIRPRRDNKYQKLDIEYAELSPYADLIAAYEAGDDTSSALMALAAFRAASVRRAATERLGAAEQTAENARETITRTTETITDLREKIRELRTRLTQAKKSIGREPTKQTAAKVLRAESQMDAANEKLRRAKKRLDNAQRRLLVAEDEITAAREILERLHTDNVEHKNHQKNVAASVPATPRFTEVVPQNYTEFDDEDDEQDDTDDDYTDNVPAVPQFTEIVTAPRNDITIQETNEPGTEQMADMDDKNKVKPLFDKDPEILDEEIAFKPIEFDAPITPIPETPAPRTDATPVAPMSFTPPAAPQEQEETTRQQMATPVLDTIVAVESPQEPVAPTYTEINTQPQPTSFQPQPAPMPEISVAPANSGTRPVSPIRGVAVSDGASNRAQKPTLLYYIMLIALIALSIFTLWLYQKTTGNTTPDLAPAVTPEQQAPAVSNDADAFIPTGPMIMPVPDQVDVAPTQTEIYEPEPELEQVVIEQEPVIEPEPEDVPIANTETEETTFIEVPSQSPFLTPEPVVEEVTQVEIEEEPAEPVVNKPAYNVSQNENMFVAGPEYDNGQQQYYYDNAPATEYYDDGMQYYDDGAQYYEEDVYYQPQSYENGYPTDGGREYYYEEDVVQY